jgi:tetratricopeptide (TPR) repeat protein
MSDLPIKWPGFRPKLLIAALVVLGVVGYLWYQDYVVERAPREEEPELVTWVDRGLSEEAKAELELRIQTLEAAMATDSEIAGDISKILELGNLKYRFGDLAGAREQYEKILSTHPTDAPAHENLGQTLLEMGDFAGAEEHWRAAIAASPYEVTYIKLADLIVEQFPDRQAEIQPLLEEAIATLGQSAGLLVRLGEWYAANGLYDEAISHYKVAKQLEPDNEGIDTLISEAKSAKAKAAEQSGE